MNELMITYPKQPSAFIGEILKVVSAESAIPVDLILMKTRKREIVDLRQKAMCLAKTFTGASLATIGSKIGNKDHATVLHSCKTVNNLIDTDKSYKGDYMNMYIKVGRVIEAMPGKTFVCKICGSTNVQMKVWISINTRQLIEAVETSDTMNNWCPECMEHTSVIPLTEYLASFESKNIEEPIKK